MTDANTTRGERDECRLEPVAEVLGQPNHLRRQVSASYRWIANQDYAGRTGQGREHKLTEVLVFSEQNSIVSARKVNNVTIWCTG